MLDHPLQYLDRFVIPIHRDPVLTHKNRIISTDLRNMVVRSMLLGIYSDTTDSLLDGTPETNSDDQDGDGECYGCRAEGRLRVPDECELTSR
jgi:hypothetical protein